FRQAQDLVEAIIPGFVGQVSRAIRRGLLAGYRLEEGALFTVRGRIRFDEQVRRRFGRIPPVEGRFDEFTHDIEENRLLKAAIRRIGMLRPRSDALRRSLRALDAAFSPISRIEYDGRRIPTIHYSRLNQHYRPAVELARLILKSTSFELGADDAEYVTSSTFLVDMADVFEDFVVI